jgi:hypothetical protein
MSILRLKRVLSVMLLFEWSISHKTSIFFLVTFKASVQLNWIKVLFCIYEWFTFYGIYHPLLLSVPLHWLVSVAHMPILTDHFLWLWLMHTVYKNNEQRKQRWSYCREISMSSVAYLLQPTTNNPNIHFEKEVHKEGVSTWIEEERNGKNKSYIMHCLTREKKKERRLEYT